MYIVKVKATKLVLSVRLINMYFVNDNKQVRKVKIRLQYLLLHSHRLSTKDLWRTRNSEVSTWEILAGTGLLSCLWSFENCFSGTV